MTENIIQFPIKEKKPVISTWTEADEWLAKLKFELVEEDYAEVQDAINDFIVYDSLEPELKVMVDRYFTLANILPPTPPKSYA